MHRQLLSRLLTAWNVFGIALIGMAVFTVIVPYNMDEFIHYDAILCHWFPGNNWHGQCDPWQLNVLNLGWVLPVRAYGYSGSFPALYFLPIHLLWRSPLAARMLGLGFLALGAVISARAMGLKWRPVVVGMLLTFPYAFQTIVDTGPIGYHILSIYLLYVLLERWCATLQTRYITLATIAVFLGIWTKFAYFWMAPGLAIILALHAWERRAFLLKREHLRTAAKHLFGCGFCLIVALSVLLLSTRPGNPADMPYMNELLGSPAYTIGEMLRGAWFQSNILNMLIQPLDATHRVFILKSPHVLSLLYSVLAYGFVPAAIAALFLAGERRLIRRPLVLYVAFIATILMIMRTKNAGAMHHAILSYPFLILATLAAQRALCDAACSFAWRGRIRHLIAGWSVAFVTVNLALIGVMTTQQVNSDSSADKQAIHTLLNAGDVSGKYMVATLDWGMFYYQGLFGHDDQSVLFEWGLKDENRIRYLQDIAREHGRKLLFAYQRDTSANIDMITSLVPVERCSGIPESSAWQMLAEPDDELRNLCDRLAATRNSKSGIAGAALKASMLL
ncbi:MAG: hypothetical protein G01um101425_642 [Candidatus Peregrinibacteria bacterium Gr01-1014_25]|nr:MAG: hypothetical protein G01um101425_642 [Candidatus Peregrinibacteria bacterium Gr01-1014_25]